MLLKKIKQYFSSIIRTVPITLKITLWYTSFITILLAVLAFGSFFAIEEFTTQASKNRLIEKVERYSVGKGRFSSYEEGVYYVLYDDNNSLVSGVVPQQFNVGQMNVGTITEYNSNGKNYIYYDLKLQHSNYGEAKYVRGIIDISDVKKSLNIIPITIIAVSPFLLALITFVGYRIIKKSFRPINSIINTAKNIDESGDLSKRISIPETRDEVYKLTVVLNKMLTTLEKVYAREKKFSSDVSHELRTPTSVISAESSYALKYIDTIEEAKESFAVIDRQSAKMTNMINQILEISRLDQLEKVELEDTNISELISAMTDDYSKLLLTNNIELEKNILENITIRCNRVLITRVVDNLVLNAIKFAKSKIKISVLKENDNILFIVEDDGEGIPEEELDNIWLRFYKVDKSRTNTENQSSGLGLSIVKKIVALHYGKIKVVGNGHLGGAKFEVILQEK